MCTIPPAMAERAPFFMPLGTLETVVSASFAVTTVMMGYVTRGGAEQRFRQFRDCLLATERPTWVIDATEVTGYEPAAVQAGARWFTEYKQRGGKDVVFVSRELSMRMIASTLSFSANVPVRHFDELRDALADLGLSTGPRSTIRERKPSSS